MLPQAYFELRALDLQTRNLAANAGFAPGLVCSSRKTLANGGATSMLDVRQAEQLVDTAG